MTEAYDGRQVVGIDLHRRLSVIVRMTEDGRKLETVRITNSPVLTFRRVWPKLFSPLCRQPGSRWLPAVQGDHLGCGIPPVGGGTHDCRKYFAGPIARTGRVHRRSTA
jgi:hypothetical protein